MAIAVCALAVIFFIAAMLLVSPAGYGVSETWENMSWGAPLLSRGDELAYGVVQGNASSGLVVKALGVDSAAGCGMLRQEYPGQQNITACYSENGTVAYVLSGTVPLAREEFAGVPVIHAFEPWMAGARVGWSGVMVVTRSLKPGLIQIMQLGESIETRYRCTGEENVSGRRALRVESDILRDAREREALRRTVAAGGSRARVGGWSVVLEVAASRHRVARVDADVTAGIA